MIEAKVENRGIDNGIFEFICRNEHFPAFQTMGFNLVYVGEGKAGMKMIADPKFTTFEHRLHGGTIATLADTVMGVACATLGYNVETVDINLNYLAPVFEGNELKAEAYVSHAGKTLIIVEGRLFNNEAELIASSRGTFIKLNIKASS